MRALGSSDTKTESREILLNTQGYGHLKGSTWMAARFHLQGEIADGSSTFPRSFFPP